MLIKKMIKKLNSGNGPVKTFKDNRVKGLRLGAAGLLLAIFASVAQAGPSITDIEFSSRPGSKFEIRLDFDQIPNDINAYTIIKPARIAIDFPDTGSALERKSYSLPYGNATGVVVLESGDRTRMVVNLVKLVPYETRVEGNSLFVLVGQDGGPSYVKQTSDPNRLETRVEPVTEVRSEISDLQFQRTGGGEGRLHSRRPGLQRSLVGEAREAKVVGGEGHRPGHLHHRLHQAHLEAQISRAGNSGNRCLHPLPRP